MRNVLLFLRPNEFFLGSLVRASHNRWLGREWTKQWHSHDVWFPIKENDLIGSNTFSIIQMNLYSQLVIPFTQSEPNKTAQRIRIACEIGVPYSATDGVPTCCE